MKKLFTFLFFPFFLTACTAKTQEMWTDFTEGFNHDPERTPAQVAKGHSGSAQASFNKGVAKNGKMPAVQKAKASIAGHQRIDTTQCIDLDDWYLDGFRVGKSFRSQKAEMLQKRTQNCQGKLPNGYQHYWEKGYQIGVKS